MMQAAPNQTESVLEVEPNTGMLSASLENRTVWTAVRGLRREMRRLPRPATVIFLMLLDRDGRPVDAGDQSAARLVLAYRERSARVHLGGRA